MPEKKVKMAREEEEVLEKISTWCQEHHPRAEVQKSEYEKLIEETGEKKIIDATIIGHYRRRSKSGAKGCLIAELEFEEHKKPYSILKGRYNKITFVLRKLPYWRHDIPQYWIKIDSDGTPFMINYRHIYERRHIREEMHPDGKYTKPNQIIRIVAAERDSRESKWPNYVIIGWDKIFKELDRVIKRGKF